MSGGHPLSADRSGAEKMPMDTMEVLTLVLVIFAILAYLDDRYDRDRNKKK